MNLKYIWLIKEWVVSSKNLVRVVNGVSGESVKFQKVAKGSATTKARHAEVVAMNIVHTNVTATLSDFYASDYVDKLDELKSKH